MINTSLVQKSAESQSHHLIAALLEERSELWAMYCKIAEMKPEFDNSEKVRPILLQFAQLLIDYVSLGHFGIYEHILSKHHQQASILSYANQLYPAFSSTTTTAMIFNDAYESNRRLLNSDKLLTDLSNLGEHLAKRMELEDKLCSMLLH